MSAVSEVLSGMQSAQAQAADTKSTSDVNKKTSKVSGKTIGNPNLSESGAKYYEELKKKFSNMDFILVSKDQKEMAKSQAASYANPHRMVVLIDEEKIERMASDENYRKQYEGIITNGANSLNSLAEKLKNSGANVTAFGMQVKDGRASFFTAVEKGFASQRSILEKRQAAKKEAKKAETKKAAKKAEEAKRKERLEGKKADKAKEAEEKEVDVLSADSVEELMQKVDDYVFARKSDAVWTKEERNVGQNIDYSL